MSEEDVDALGERLDAADEAIEEATAEAEYEEVAETLEAIEADIEAAELPEPEADDESSPEAELSERLTALETRLEEHRGPYASDVVASLEESAGTIEDTRWTDTGNAAVQGAVATVLETLTAALDADLEVDPETAAEAAAALESSVDAVDAAGLDPDDDAATITTLLEAAETLESDLEAAEAWSDLSVRQQLAAEGFYDVLEHHKDFPPEWSALKEWEQRGRVDMVALAYEQLDSEFMEEHCLEAFKRMGDPAALDAIESQIDRRDAAAIEIAGKTGSERPVDTLLEYVDEDGDRTLQLATIRALGEIGTEDAVQPIADQLAADDESVRSRAARSLGLIGDTRAIDPLTETLAADEADDVRASAAWALNQIGTERARDALAAYTDDEAYLVESEAAKAV